MALFIDRTEVIAGKFKREYATMNQAVQIRNTVKMGKENRKTVFALLDTNPTLKLNEIIALTGINEVVVSRLKRKYAEIHGKQPNLQEKVFALLDKDPNLSSIQLAKLLNSSQSKTYIHKKLWLELHNETPVISFRDVGAKNREAIFALLDQNPSHSSSHLAKLVGCDFKGAQKYKRQWLKLHSAGEPPNEASAD